MEGDGTHLSSLSINLREVATGPYHFDYEFVVKSQPQVRSGLYSRQKQKKSSKPLVGKINFDLKMA
jgi:hypothetical protein